jgi:hypothetical protein
LGIPFASSKTMRVLIILLLLELPSGTRAESEFDLNVDEAHLNTQISSLVDRIDGRHQIIECNASDRASLMALWKKAEQKDHAPTPEELKELSNLVSRISDVCLGKEFAQNVRGVLKWYGLFPCGPEDFKKPVTLIFAGEEHGPGDCDVRRDQYHDLALANKILLGGETNVLRDRNYEPYEDHPNLLKNLDTHQALQLSFPGMLLINRYRIAKPNVILIQNNIYLMIHYSSVYPPLIDAWKKLPRASLSEKAKEVASYVDGFLTPDAADRRATFLKDPDHHSDNLLFPGQDAAIFEVFELLATQVKKELDEPTTRFSFLTPKEPALGKDFFKHQKNRAIFYKSLFMRWRERLLSNGAADLVCQAAIRGFDFAVLYEGGAHLGGSYGDVKDLIRRSGLDQKVHVLVDTRLLSCPKIQEMSVKNAEDEFRAHQTKSVRDTEKFLKSLPPTEQLTDEKFLKLFGT